MRKILFLFFVGIIASQAETNPAQESEKFYNQGLAAEKAGDPVAAKKAYQEALRLNPRHANAQYKIGELKADSGKISAAGREAKFGAIVIPQIALEGASLQEALDALRLSIEKSAGTDSAPNFIIQDPGNKLQNVKVTLQLKGVPAKGVLGYILTQASAKAIFDEYAIVIAPNRSGS